jgi:hypothetical protein
MFCSYVKLLSVKRGPFGKRGCKEEDDERDEKLKKYNGWIWGLKR